jgi:FlaA1/EpsC-like NDP-sugar epimerase
LAGEPESRIFRLAHRLPRLGGNQEAKILEDIAFGTFSRFCGKVMMRWSTRRDVSRSAPGACDNRPFMNNPFAERCVLLTGAGGSIGSALAKAIIRQDPRSLILLDHSESHLYQIDFDLSSLPGGHVRTPVLGDVGDGALLAELFEERKPEVVIHAAAFKQVPLMERNPIAAVQNNAIGTNLLAQAAQRYEVATFVMLSTDKAVNPHSVMGASKRVAELALLRWSSSRSPMRAVRLGNVYGSQGSVVPAFLQQISRAGPITVTDPGVNRYFLSMDEAVERVLLAARLVGGGGIFIPDLGEPVRILELAQQLIQEAGLQPERDIPIVMTGLRPGDKMAEQIVSDRESVEPADNAMLRMIKTPQPSDQQFDFAMAAMKESAARRDLAGVLEQLCRLAPEYRPSEVVLASARAPQSSAL